MLVMKKKTQFMIPNAKHALSIAHVLSTSTPYAVPEALPNGPKLTSHESPDVMCVQSAVAIMRSAHTAPMKAPTKSRSMIDTKVAFADERW